MKSSTVISLFLLTTLFSGTVNAESYPAIFLKVIGNKGKPVSDFQVSVIDGHSSRGWQNGKEGNIRLGGYLFSSIERSKSIQCDLIIRAEGYAPRIVGVDEPAKEVKLKVKLKEGRPVRLTIKDQTGRPIPQSLRPVLFYKRHESLAMRCQRIDDGTLPSDITEFYPFQTERIADGQYLFQWPEDREDIYVCINEPGFLQGYIGGPYSRRDLRKGEITADLPKPAKTTIQFNSHKEDLGDLPFKSVTMQIMKSCSLIDRRVTILDTREFPAGDYTVTVDDLSPGKYTFTSYTRPITEISPSEYGKPNPGCFRDFEKTELCEGAVHNINHEYEELDKNQYKGGHDLTLKVLDTKGKPAGGQEYNFGFMDEHYGASYFQEGSIPQSGVLELKGLNITRGYSLYVLLMEGGMFPIKIENQNTLHHEQTITLAPVKNEKKN